MPEKLSAVLALENGDILDEQYIEYLPHVGDTISFKDTDYTVKRLEHYWHDPEDAKQYAKCLVCTIIVEATDV